MKKKLILISCLIFCFSFALSLKPMFKQATKPQTADFDEEIVAPAILDSVADVTHLWPLQPNIVKKIHVQLGQLVEKDQLLISLDDSLQQDKVKADKINFIQAKNNLALEERTFDYALKNLIQLKEFDKRVINQHEIREKEHEVELIRIRLKQAKQHLKLAKINLNKAETILRQYSIVAPKKGIILQINTHENEYAAGGQPILFLGDADKIIVRVSIDEREAYQFNAKAKAYLMLDTINIEKFPLQFIQLNQYIVTEARLNSRVQEVLYYLDRKQYPKLVAGQQLSAHIPIQKLARA